MGEDYWEAEMEEEFQIRERATKMGINDEDVKDLLRERGGDAFSITKEDLENLKH